MSKKTLFLFGVAALAAGSYAQVDPDMEAGGEGTSQARKDDRAKFHPTPVKGMPAADRFASYKKRLSLEADSPFGNVKWRNVGPEEQGGRIVDIAAPLGDPGKLYVAYATGGLYRSDDDGQSWTNLWENQSCFGIGSIALNKTGTTIWLGSGEANSQRTSYSGDGVYKSTDSGKTWQNMGLPESHHINKIVIDPHNENVVWVAALGHLYSQHPERGLYKTTDGGKTWTQVLKVDEYTGCFDVVLDPRNSNHVIASMWDKDRRAWNFRDSGDGSGVYQSFDGGKTWSKVSGLPDKDEAGRIGLAWSASSPKLLMAFATNDGEDEDWAFSDERVQSGKLTLKRFLLLTEETFVQVDKKILEAFFKQYPVDDWKIEELPQLVKDKKVTVEKIREAIQKKSPKAFAKGVAGEEVYRSDDGGKTWTRTPGGKLGQAGGYYYNKVWINPYDANEVYLTGVLLHRSTDGGKNFEPTATRAHVDFHAVWNDPREPRKVWYGCDGGLYRSYDGGKTVQHINNLSVAQATTVAVDNKTPYNIYLGLQDNGTMRGPSNYVPGQSDINLWKDIGGGDGSHIAIDPRNSGDLVYAASQFGAHFALNQKTNESWDARANAATGEPALRYNWVSPLIISPHQNDIIYLGSQKVYRSFNQGRKWEAISPDLTKNLPNGNVPYSTIKTLSESPIRFGLIYAGCDDGSVKMTPNGGFEWKDISTPLTKKWVSRVVASRYDVATVYCSQSGYREDDFSAYLWKSTDYGKTWKSIVNNLPNETINVIQEDPTHKNILYVGTDLGVYVSLDNGATWETLHGALPHQPVHDLVIQERDKDLVIGTHSRGAYVLPLKWVYDINKDLRTTDLTVVELEELTWRNSWSFDSKPRGRFGPMLRTTVFAKEAGKGFLRIKDEKGKVLKEQAIDALKGYNFLEMSLELEPAKPHTVDVKNRKVKTVEDVLADPYGPERPKLIGVGTYKVEIVVGNKTIVKDWKIVND